jgi:fimbrial chaperone protein
LRALTLTTFLLITTLFPANALADGGLSVQPTRVNLDTTQRSAEITVSNGNSAAELLRVEAMSWEQVNGKDRYAPTEELLVVPPLLRVEAGDKQIVRLALRGGVLSGTRERTYRIILTEIPSTMRKTAGPTLGLALHFLIPVYANAGSLKTTKAAAGLIPSAHLDGMKHVHLTVTNVGDRHVVINAIRMYADASQSRLIAEQSSNTVAVLAGTNHTFDLTAHETLTLPTIVIQGIGANGPFTLLAPVTQAGVH